MGAAHTSDMTHVVEEEKVGAYEYKTDADFFI